MSSSAEQLVVWADAAEQCEQTDLRLACAAQLAQRLVLASTPGEHALPAGIADAAQLEGCSNSTLLLILGLVTGAFRQLAPQASISMFGFKAPRRQPGAYKAPATDSIAAALQQAASPGSFEWRIEKFAQQPAQRGRSLQSPWFMSGGREWQLLVYLNGDSQVSEGHVSRKWGRLYVAPGSNTNTTPAAVKVLHLEIRNSHATTSCVTC